jgi:cytochrome c-type biogenesis protein CcmH/NrfG
VVAGVAAVAAAAALAVSAVLDDPVAENPTRDATPIVVGPVVEPGQELTGGESALPPLTMVLEQPAPDDISTLPAAQQVARLRELLETQAEPERFVELGSAYMALGDKAAADDAFDRARRLLPGRPAPLIGLAMSDALEGSEGLDAAARQMAVLRERFPQSQVVAFNQGWLAVYRRDVATVRDAWERTIALDATSPLGTTAAALLEQVGAAQAATP